MMMRVVGLVLAVSVGEPGEFFPQVSERRFPVVREYDPSRVSSLALLLRFQPIDPCTQLTKL
jgi:hypothetical protein